MNTDLIKSELDRLMEEFDNLEEDWALAKASKEEIDDRKLATLAIIESNVEGSSEAERKRKALKNTLFEAWIQEATKRRTEFYKIDHKKDGLEKRIDVLRSLLSFEKSQINRTI